MKKIVVLLFYLIVIGLTSNSISATYYSDYDKKKPLFDADLYYSLYPDLQKAYGNNSSALYNHWKKYGISEGRIASIYFDAEWYLKQNPDVANAYGRKNYAAAYKHYVDYGMSEGRSGSRWFSPKWYVQYYTDLRNAYGTNYIGLLLHYNNYTYYGTEFRASNKNVNIGNYKNRYPDLREAFGNSIGKTYWIHLLEYGVKEKRNYR